jgi:hypothetical protein
MPARCPSTSLSKPVLESFPLCRGDGNVDGAIFGTGDPVPTRLAYTELGWVTGREARSPAIDRKEIDKREHRQERAVTGK